MANTLPKALFVGNGINKVSRNAISWGELLGRLSQKFEIDIDLSNELKPFPLAFEEMIHHSWGEDSFEQKLRNLKVNISELLLSASSEFDYTIHKQLMRSGITEIITTNYDYNLELSDRPTFMEEKREIALNRQESKLSLYRGYNLDGVKIRHIHGELLHNRSIADTKTNYPEESIMIGFEHYSDYYHKIQTSIKGPRNKYKEGILARISGEKEGKIWMDLFFTHNIYFLGFSMDFSETHLWWLLMEREEIIRKYNFFGLPQNTIAFLFPDMPITPAEYKSANETQFNELYRKKLVMQKNKAITDLIKLFKVEIIPIKCESYGEFYQKAIQLLQT